MKGELIKAQAADHVVLNGFYCAGNKNKPLFLHVHGYAGTFFHNQFVHTIGDTIVENDYAFLTVETRGSYGVHGFAVHGKGYRTMGGDRELLEEAYLDIDAWVKFALSEGYTSITLQGHSLATFKTIRYLSEGKHKDAIGKLVLLAPFDKNGLLIKNNPEWQDCIKIAEQKVINGCATETIPSAWKSNDLSFATFHSWYKESEFNRVFDFYREDYQSLLLKNISLPVHVIVGDQDEYFSVYHIGSYLKPFDLLQSQLQKGSGLLIPESRHSFRNHEQTVADSVLAFMS